MAKPPVSPADRCCWLQHRFMTDFFRHEVCAGGVCVLHMSMCSGQRDPPQCTVPEQTDLRDTTKTFPPPGTNPRSGGEGLPRTCPASARPGPDCDRASLVAPEGMGLKPPRPALRSCFRRHSPGHSSCSANVPRTELPPPRPPTRPSPATAPAAGRPHSLDTQRLRSSGRRVTPQPTGAVSTVAFDRAGRPSGGR